jgi:hypothetical protein
MPLPNIPPGIEAELDAILADALAQLVIIQPVEIVSGDIPGRYWQGQTTPAATPADGATEPLDTSLTPSDRARSWADVGITSIDGIADGQGLKCQLAAHESLGDSGAASWWLVGCVELQGSRWTRAIDGAGDSHAHPWREE